MAGLEALGDVGSFGSIVHGTTVGTNMLLERRGPRIGVITTRGFRDVLEMRRRDRRQTWGLWGELVPIASKSTNARSPTARSAPPSMPALLPSLPMS